MRRVRPDLLALAALALLSNFAYLYLSNGDYFFPDSITYLRPAHNLLRGLGFALEPGVAEVFRTPGYPLFLIPFVALTTSMVPILIAQHLLNVALTLGVYWFAERLSGSRTAAATAGLVFALDVPSIHYANKVLSETLFTVALFVLFALTVRIMRRGSTPLLLVTAALIAGALVIIRPVAIVYFFIVALFLAWSGLRRAVIVFLAIALVIPAAWVLRNHHKTGVFTLATVAGANMLSHRAAAALAIEDNTDFRADLARHQAELIADADQEIVEEEEVRDINQVDSALRAEYYSRIGRRIALEHPFALALVLVRGLFVNLFESDWQAAMLVTDIPSVVVNLAISVVPPAVAALAVIGLAGIWRRDPPLAALIAATVFYFLFMSAGSEAEARFRVPVTPLIAIAAGVGAEVIRRGTREMTNAA